MNEKFKPDSVGLIINPNARRVRRTLERRKFFWEEFFEESLVRITPDVPSIPAALESFKQLGINVLAIYGGDGTLQRTVTAAVRVWGAEEMPPALVLKGGTANALIKNMGVRKKARNYLRFFWSLLASEKLEKVELHEVPMLKVDDEHTGQTNYGFIFANGLAYRSTVRFHGVESPGAWQTFKEGIYPIIARAVGTKRARQYFESPIMTVDVDGKYHHEGPVNVVLLSTLKKLILWYAPFSGNIMDTSGFYGIVNYMDLDELFANFIALVRGKYEDPGNINEVMHDVRIRASEGYMLDGELFVRDSHFNMRITRGPSLKVVILPVL